MILKILGPGTILIWLKWFHGQTGADEYIFDIDNDVETDDDTDNMLNNDDNTSGFWVLFFLSECD